jgi:hypothetical protein
MSSLRQVRISLEERIEGLGFEVAFAEYDFDAPPDLSISEACMRNVERCDILVLIVDGSYGTPLKGDWLVRSEFMRAKRLHKAIYVMVDYDTWRDYNRAVKHPDADPEHHYEIHPEVVRFLREIASSGDHFIHSFRTEKDLFDILKKQFAVHYAKLMRTRSEALLFRTSHLLEQMHNLYRQTIYVQALLFAEEVLRIDKDNSEALVTRAVCKIRLYGLDDLKSIREGIEDCNKVVANDPHDYRARYNRANFKLLSPEYDISQVEEDLKELYLEFPEYEFYFKEDKEFNRMMRLRKSWSRSTDGTKS